ncbi:coiled-coil domain-containing glutamate-rich protein 1 [Molossus nigricans]
MTQTLNKSADPLNAGSGWASSAPCRTWSSCHQRRRGAPIYKRRQHYGSKAQYEPQRKRPKPRYGPGPWFPPPRSPHWAMYSNWGCWGGPWCPPPMGYRKPPSPVQATRMYGLHPVCLCCCVCWRGPWNPGWARPPGRKKRWGRRGRGLRRHPSRPLPRSPPVEVSPLLRQVNRYGMRAPRNTTQFIMNQIYEDMQQQEKLERQQEALRAQQAQAGGTEALPMGEEEDAELQDILYGFVQNPSLAFSPIPEAENQAQAPQLVEEEEEEKYEEECDGKEESEEEDEEAEPQDEEEVEEEEAEETEEEGLEEDEQRGEENHLPLEMPLSFLMEAEEERESFINCSYLSPEQIIPKVPQDALLLQDTNC